MRFLYIGMMLWLFVVFTGVERAWSAPGAGGVAEEGESGGVITPAIQGVPKIFLPDIGIAGDFAYEQSNLPRSDPRYSGSPKQPHFRDGQVVFFSPIDPFTNAQFTVDLPENGVANIEEGWLNF